MSRELKLDINILLANIENYDTTICGVLIIEITAHHLLLEDFINRCKQAR